MKLRHIDFETYYADDYTVSKMTPEEYVRDPRFQVIGFSIMDDATGHVEWVTGADIYIAGVLHNIDWKNTVINGHNMSEFDSLILGIHYGIRPRAYQCTLQMARTVHGAKASNSLGALGEKYGLGAKGDEVIAAKNKRKEDFTPAQLAAYGAYCIKDTQMTAKLYHILRKQFPPQELQAQSWVTRMYAEPRLNLDADLLKKLHRQLLDRKEAVLDKTADFLQVDAMMERPLRHAATQKLLRSDGKFSQILEDEFGIPTPMKLSPKRKNPDGTPMWVPAFAKTDEAMQDLAEDDTDEDLNALVHARLGSKSTIAESRLERFIGIASRGPLPVPMVYGKTVTHRLAGGGKINLQNVPGVRGVDERTHPGSWLWTPDGYKRMWKRNLAEGRVATEDRRIYQTKHVHVAGLRDAIVVPPGKKLVVVDSSNIELRVVHLLAGQHDTVAKLRAGVDLYCDFASVLYGYPVQKGTHKKERQHGKVGMLQLQYQSGADSFRRAARIMGGIKLTPIEAADTVGVYRSTFTALPKHWRRQQRAIEAIVRGEEMWLDDHGLCRTTHNGIILPNGMKLQYDNLRQHTFENDDKPSWVYDNKETRKMKNLYGGSITENQGQALARIVVFDQTLEIEKKWGRTDGNGVVLSVHDEVGCIVDEDDAEECLDFMVACMGQSPKWWPELPVAAEGGIGNTYGECK